MDINGKKLVNIPHAVSNLITNDERQDQAISELEERVRQALVGVFHYKGSVATYADLPVADNQVGDVYNVLDTGANYAWAGTDWDDLSGIVDLSNYVTIDGAQTITGTKTFNEITVSRIVGSYDIQGSILPRVDNTFSLGTSSLRFKDIYSSNDVITTRLKSTTGSLRFRPNNLTYDVVTLSSSEFFTYVKMRPAATGIDLGDSSNLWRDIYLSGLVNLKNSAASIGWSITENSSDLLEINREGVNRIRMGNSYFAPGADNTIDLGLSTLRWKAAHIEELDVYFGSYQFQISDGGFGQLYIGRSDGTNGILVDGGLLRTRGMAPRSNNLYDLGTSSNKWRDIFLSGNLSDGTNSVTVADLKALIDYAKAQGWIS